MSLPIDDSAGNEQILYGACERFVAWLEHRVLVAGRGDELTSLDVEPSGSFWLGRLAPEDAVVRLGLGDRGERLDPCAIGMRLKPVSAGPWAFTARVRARCWLRGEGKVWSKTVFIDVDVPAEVPPVAHGSFEFGAELLAEALRNITGDDRRQCVVRVDVEPGPDGCPELEVTFCNITPEPENPRKEAPRDDNLYEATLRVTGLDTAPFQLESLPDSFRYDRRVGAYGINCGASELSGAFETADTIVTDRARPRYWGTASEPPDLRFEALAVDPMPSLQRLVDALSAWGNDAWSNAALDQRQQEEAWTPEMRNEAAGEAVLFEAELGRIAFGLSALRDNGDLRAAFKLMNQAMIHAANGRYEGWRPFQIGFLLANIGAVVDADAESGVADIVWFATGGGKTETYLGLLITAAIFDRLRGKTSGITAWSRFPLRMLSLQQTQRFADAMAGAEIARQAAGIAGDSFSVGFFVGQGATPNSIKLEPIDGGADPDDDNMPSEYQVLLRCPFCHEHTIEMAFNRRLWKLEHRCTNPECAWAPEALPFYVVDEEIFRFLPTVVVGTLDKAALISMQAAMRAFVGSPHGKCSEEGHGYAYAPRSTRRNGCLVPGCPGKADSLDMDRALFPPTFRLQDELHLLRDSLGAVDAHYEALLDDLQTRLTGHRPKILASSATLSGYRKQVDVLYQRSGRVFPLQGPTAKTGFWTSDTNQLARRFVAIAPRGVTLEFVVDRMLTQLQNEVRRLIEEPNVVCDEAGIDPNLAPELLSIYGTDVVYGNSLRDLDAATRSLETQVLVEPPGLNTAVLTGRTEFEEVRETLDRLDRPEPNFADRIHVIAASSMMSHGVDIDRLNLMIVLGLPLTTAEFIQTTARVGRRWPGLVFVAHKIARERDAGIYRSFAHFISQGDRFVEPVPITRRSRRVLGRTLAGLELARILDLHEPRSGIALTTVKNLRQYFRDAEIDEAAELAALVETLGVSDDLDAPMRDDMSRWVDAFFANLMEPSGNVKFPSDLCPWGKPMISLRDVEEQAPIRN